MSHIIKCSNQIGKHCLRRTKTSSVITYKWLWSLRLNRSSSDSTSNKQENDEKILNKVKSRKSKLSPTSRILDMLSTEKSSETNLNNSNVKEKESVFHNKTEKDAETDPAMDFDNQGSTDKVKQMAKSAMNRRR